MAVEKLATIADAVVTLESDNEVLPHSLAGIVRDVGSVSVPLVAPLFETTNPATVVTPVRVGEALKTTFPVPVVGTELVTVDEVAATGICPVVIPDSPVAPVGPTCTKFVPSFQTATVAPFAIVIPVPVGPITWIDCPPVVAFSIVNGKRPAGAIKLRVAVKLTDDVTLR